MNKIAQGLREAIAAAPRNRHRALGRLPVGQMNKTEARYAQHLELRKAAGEILWWKFEAMKFRLADKTFLMPDFAVLTAASELEMHETKGFMEEDANVKLKVCAAMYPVRFIVVRAVKGVNGNFWQLREV